MTNRFTDSPFEGQLEVVATLSESVIKASLNDQAEWENLIRALREMADAGIPIDDLSSASGLSPAAIRKAIKREPRNEDILDLFGLR